MSLRQQQIAVFLGTIVIISGLFAAGVWLIAQRLTTEATLQTALLMARHEEVKGLMRAYVDRSGSIEAMWVLNAEGKVLYASAGQENTEVYRDAQFHEALRRGVTLINSRTQGKATYYDVMVPLQMPEGVRGPGGLRLWIDPADWSELLTGMWRQLTLLFALGGGIALLSAFLTTGLYTRRFSIISETLRQAE